MAMQPLQYADNATYGAENVWDDDYLAVYHMQELNALDSTSNADATAVGDTPAPATGLFGAVLISLITAVQTILILMMILQNLMVLAK